MRRPVIERVLEQVKQEPNGCWSFNGYHNKKGYAKISNTGGTDRVHKLMYEHFVGPVPQGLVLDHEHCDNPGCVNPYHLVPKTIGENIKRGRHPGMVTHRTGICANGHDITGEHGYQRPSNGKRECRTCHAIRERARTKAAKTNQLEAAS